MDPTEERPARWKNKPTWLLSQAAAHGHRLLVGELASVGARGYHARVLATLDEFGPASQAELGRRSSIHLSDMVATMNELAEHQLIERTPDPSDRRRNVISLTPAGEERLRLLEERLAAAQEALMAPLSPREREQLTALLSRLVDYHDGRSGGTG